jgi:hypothetical protein
MSQYTEQQMLDVLREIRDTHRDTLEAIRSQQTLVKEQLEISRSTVGESVALQRLSHKRQRTVTLIAIPGTVFCIVVILYLVVRYF